MIDAPIESRRLIGRTAELAALHECRRELSRRRGRVVLVGGPAGIGKSRLLREFCRAIGGGRAPILIRTECIERGDATFEPIRNIVAGLTGGADAAFDEAVHDALERGTFFRSISSIVRSASEKRAIVICIEDIHWADPTTLEFLAFLATRIVTDRILIVATYRDDEIEATPASPVAAALARLFRASTVERIALRPLDEKEMLVLVDSALSIRERPPESAVRRVVARAEGNPFYAEELLETLLDGGGSDDLPHSIEGMVLERFAALDEDERRVVQYGAVLGYRFDPDLLREILPIEEGTLARALRHACERNLVVEEPGAQLRFRFRHALTHEAIAGRMLEFEARPLHARVAQLLESLPETSRRPGEIAYHWWKAKDPARAVGANEAAGDAAMSVHAYGDAVTLYERALALASEREDRTRLYSRAGTAESVQGHQLGAIAYFEQALTLELEAKRFSNAAQLVRRIAGRLVYAGEEGKARARLETFLRSYRSELTKVDSLLVEGWPILIDLGGGGVRAWRERLLNSDASSHASGKEVWELLLLEINAHASVGDHNAWNDSVERMRPYMENGGAFERALSMMAVALTAAHDGTDAARAAQTLEDVHAYCERSGLESLRKYISTCDAFHRYLHGDVQGARTAAHLGLFDPDDTNQRTNLAVIGPLVGLDLEDAELIALAADETLSAAIRRDGCLNSTALAAAGIAGRLRSLGRDAEAADICERAVEHIETLFGAQFVLPIAARCISTTRARERIEDLLESVEDGDRSGRATRGFVRAIFAHRDGRADARDQAMAAAQEYGALGWSLLQAQALELAGEISMAAEIYMRCGSLHAARRLKRGRAGVAFGQHTLSQIPALSPREREVAAAVAAGLGNLEIAERLGLSVKTVEKHLARIYARLGLRSRAQLGAFIGNELRERA
jgi:DNA-binding CsgD family transcriptional regulator